MARPKAQAPSLRYHINGQDSRGSHAGSEQAVPRVVRDCLTTPRHAISPRACSYQPDWRNRLLYAVPIQVRASFSLKYARTSPLENMDTNWLTDACPTLSFTIAIFFDANLACNLDISTGM